MKLLCLATALWFALCASPVMAAEPAQVEFGTLLSMIPSDAPGTDAVCTSTHRTECNRWECCYLTCLYCTDLGGGFIEVEICDGLCYPRTQYP